MKKLGGNGGKIMNIITISREFGSGGRELGKRLADFLGYDYYDSEIISAVAEKSGLDADYVEYALSNHGWQNHEISFRSTLSSSAYLQSFKVNILLQQKKVIEEIAALGKDCVIVGRNADMILREYHPFNVFVCAEMGAKVKRCMERASDGEKLNEKELVRKIKQIDKNRAYTREIIGGPKWGQRDSYHLTVNTTDFEIKKTVPAVAEFANVWFGREK